ncbi:MAG: hypothetical protein PVSMB4_13970 [Ktedonobacterales bacterium]
MQGSAGPLGAVEFFSRRHREPDDEIVQTIAAVGSQLGQFIERTRAEAALRENEARKTAIL